MSQTADRRIPNEMQQAFIDDFDNHSILYAGAGTGKTFSIAKKIQKAMLVYGFKKEDILCLTFTSKGKQEMERDISSFVEGGLDRVFTIHGFCLRVLKEEAKRTSENYADPRVLDNDDFAEWMKNDVIPDFSEKLFDRLLKERTGKPLSFYRTLPPVLLSPVLVWKTEEGYVDAFGISRQAEWVAFMEKKQRCPHCGQRLVLNDGLCSDCFTDFRSYVPDTFQYDYYNFFTAIRHLRCRLNLQSDDRVRDFNAAISALKKDETAFRSAMQQKNKLKKREYSETFAKLMEQFGAEFLSSYLSLMERENLIDYDGMIFRTLRLFEERPEIKRNYRYKMVIVDEMQDTSEVEFRILEHVFEGALIVFCGDCFQTIYEWRGSEPGRMLKTLKEKYHAVDYRLLENYRSTKTLCMAGYSYLKNAFPSDAMLPREIKINSNKEGEKIRLEGFESDALQASWIFRNVKKYSDRSVCLMARSNYSAENMARCMQRINDVLPPSEQLSFYTSQEENNFFSNAGMKDAIAFLQVLLRPFDVVAMERVASRYAKGAGKKTLSALRESPYCKVTSFLSPYAYSDFDEFAPWLNRDGTFVVYDLETTGLDRTYDELIQIAAVRFDGNGKELARMNELVIPSVPISEGAFKTHRKGLDELRQKGTKNVKVVLEKFAAFAKGSFLFGHNSTAFDRVILKRQMKENGLSFPDVISEGDTLLAAKRLLPALKNYKLETLCALFGIVNESAHDAFSDVLATKAVFLELRNRYILPFQTERRAETSRYAEKFAKFFAFYQEAKKAIEENKPDTLCALLEKTLMHLKRNKEDSTFQSRWNAFKARLSQAEGCLEALLQEFVEEATRSGNQFSLFFNDKQKIPIVTVHQTKGCEYDVVFLFDLDDRGFPSFSAIQSGKEEEERRLFYVAMTRAKEKLFLSYCNRDYSGAPVSYSRYVDFISSEFLSVENS
ncbi:MAG: UvrD-helicase domain-containing protein [Clostridia bacterium]|nr:UvrD-helicase domain-containing protein [Clostridia bacterium]